MYLAHFRLKAAPFQITPDADFLYMSQGHARAKAYMDYTIRNRDGFVVITGEVGAGKTTLIGKLLSEFGPNVVVAKLFQTQLNEVEFLQAALVEFGLQPFKAASKVELMDMLTTFLVDSFHQGKQVVLIVDEAQNLSPRVLEEIRMLSGIETQKEKILHVILVGQPELNATLDSPQLEQLLQRVRLRFHIGALTESETRDYIQHRLKVAGCERRLFAADAIPLVFQYSGGIPRLINTLCDTAMMCAYADYLPTVTRASVRAALDELQWQPFAERVSRRLAAPSSAGASLGLARPAANAAQTRAPGATSGATAASTPAQTMGNTAANAPALRLAAVRSLPTVGDGATVMEQLHKQVADMNARLENVESLLAQALALLERRSPQRSRKISVRLGRAQLSQLVKHLAIEMEKGPATRAASGKQNA